MRLKALAEIYTMHSFALLQKHIFSKKIQLRTFEQVDVPDARRGREELLVPGEDPEGRVLGGPHGERPDFRPGDAWFFICFFVDKLRVEG